MRSSITAVFIIALACLTTVSSAEAKNTTLCFQAHGVREAVVKKYGVGAAGRNICRHKLHGGMTPTSGQKARYLRSLRAANIKRRPYLAIKLGPRVPPARVVTASYQPTGLAACIVHHESKGDPLADNGSHWGIGQWTIEAWTRHGGGAYANHPHGASYQQQLVVLSQGLARYGCRDWCPFDPC